MQTNYAGGNCLAYITAGEWLNYTVNAPSNFTAQVRYNVAQDPGYASIYAFRLSVDGQTMDVQNSYGGCGWWWWFNLFTPRPFPVSAGTHVVRINIIFGNFNLNQFEFMISTNAYAAYLDPNQSVGNRVADLMSRMSINDKIGQMAAVACEGLTNDGNIADYRLGSVLDGMGGGSVILSTNTVTAWTDWTDRSQAYALSTPLHIPTIYGIDAVHGHGNVYGATIFPHNIGLGATRDPALVQAIEQATAVEMRATGMHWAYEPEMGIGRDARWGRYYETFDETPEVAGIMGAAAIRGFQGPTLGSSQTNVLACGKHFAGDGGTVWGTGPYGGEDEGDTETNYSAFLSLYVSSYTNAIASGAMSVMVSLSSWNGTKMHTNKYALTQILKNELGFQGFIVSDWNGTDDANPGNHPQGLVDSINAGVDMVMIPANYQAYTDNMKYAVAVGNISTNRINDAVRRILAAKFTLGLFEHPYADRSLTQYVGNAAHRALARQAVRESAVVLQNQNHLLPLRTDLHHIHVAGKNADNLGYQCGGWTIYWQGGSGNITVGTTIYAAITQTVSSATQVTYSADGTGATGADVGIVVVGETPYAEWFGDSGDLSLSSTDLTAINNVRAAGVPVVVVLVTGRPLIIAPYLTNWNAAVCAWLPGSEGEGVADVLFGNYYPQSQLPHSWPVSNSQLPINVGDPIFNPLFPYNYHFGLEPSLTIAWSGSGPQLSWPYGNTGFILQSTTNLTDSASWSDLSVTQMIVGASYQVTLPPTSASQTFYRLRRPQ
jgi:beta-glucosidase